MYNYLILNSLRKVDKTGLISFRLCGFNPVLHVNFVDVSTLLGSLVLRKVKK